MAFKIISIYLHYRMKRSDWDKDSPVDDIISNLFITLIYYKLSLELKMNICPPWFHKSLMTILMKLW